jgi:prephenate dehydrogenase
LNKLVIFGVGLIGGSLALALKQAHAVKTIVGVGRSTDSLVQALELGVIDQASSDIAQAIQDADAIVIATPVAQTPSILQAIKPHLNPNTIISDAGSTKGDIAQYVAQILGDKAQQFVPAHPIAGAEKSGVTAAKVDLYQNKNVVLTPNANTSPQGIALISQMWQHCGAKVMSMSPEQHDQIFAAVSHLPHLLAFALVEELAARPNAEQLFSFAASGFRDFTRIAGSHPEMWRDISLANKAALLNELELYQNQLSQIKALLHNNDSAGLEALFERASRARNNWAKNQ